MVWSSAPRNRPSMTAKRISIFSRWLRPRAGILLEGRDVLLAGVGRECFHRLSVPPLGLRGRGGGRPARGRTGGERPRREGRPSPSRCPSSCVGSSWSRTRREDLVRGRASTSSSIWRPAGVSRTSTIRRSSGPAPFDETSLLDAIDQPGRVREGHVEHLGQPAHRHLAVALEQMHDVELRHADAEANQALAADAFELGHRRPEIGDDRGLRHGRPGCGNVVDR